MSRVIAPLRLNFREIATIFFSLFYVVLFIFIFYVYSEFWNELNKLEESWKIFASQISAVVGIIAGISGFWYNYLKYFRIGSYNYPIFSVDSINLKCDLISY